MARPPRPRAGVGAALACLRLLQPAGLASAWTVPVRLGPHLPPPLRVHRGSVPGTPRRRQRAALLTAADASSDIDFDEKSLPLLRVGDCAGSGSYGTVHRGHLVRSRDNILPCIAKRAWTVAELEADVPSKVAKLEKERRENLAVAQRTGLASVQLGQDAGGEESGDESEPPSPSKLKERADRCRHYWEVERHCFQKMEDKHKEDDVVTAAPGFLGVYADDEAGGGDLEEYRSLGEDKGHQWMVFEFVGASSTPSGEAEEPAPTLLDAMEMDWKGQHLQASHHNHHLYEIQKAMKLPESYTFGDTLDAIFLSLLENLKEIHECNIVHRDLKPGNLLCDGSNQRLRLIDFGSAADLDPSPADNKGNALEKLFSDNTARVGYDEGIVAISPVYSAPETFVKIDYNPLAFDVFSAGLIMSQLLFNLLDERTDAGFLQQLKEVNYDLDLWLEKELTAKLRPSGLDDGLEYLGERRGLWALLKQMFQKDPMKRISSSKALGRFKTITGLRSGEIEWSDDIIAEVAQEESYFETVIESFESCEANNGAEGNMPRPLHFLASFKRGTPVGLKLAEASEVEDDGSMTGDEWSQWQRATGRALPGEVFVKGWEDCSQAGDLGIFEIGDRLRGVGELPFVDGGFEKAVKLINKQPKGSATVKMHFDRMPKAPPKSMSDVLGDPHIFRVGDQGTWKSGGRRGNQEDAFVLHEIRNEMIGDVLLAGVFDGHAGTAASETVSGILPPLFTTELSASESIPKALKDSWEITCDTYRDGCDGNGECVADYDPMEGILYADTGSADLIVAGTTATMAAISMNPEGTNDLTILNCGDSRTLLVGEPLSPDAGNSFVVFETRDHSPDDELEIERLTRGQEQGLDYSIPFCSNAGSYMRVGDYQYALCRSLEGSYVTSKGIVSDPDVTTLNLATSLADRQDCALVLACDGLFEVMSNEEVGREVVRMRGEGYKAGDIAKNLCGQALKKGSYDNLSVVIVYLYDV